MADTVTSAIRQTRTHYVVHLTGISDATGETNVLKVDKSAITDLNGAEPPLLRIDSVMWCMQGYSRIKLSTDHSTDDTVIVLDGHGYFDWSEDGGLFDPNSTGGTGDLLLTSTGGASGSSYDITIRIRK